MSGIYLTNPNAGINYGLNHQLWCIVDALMIGHYTGRDIMVSGFYPDYNNDYKINLCNILDIDETNEELSYVGINSKLIPYNSRITWIRSKFPNPVFRQEFVKIPGKERFFGMIEKLKTESEYYIDLYTSFVWPLMTPYDHDPELSEQATKIFLALMPSSLIQLCVTQRLEELNIFSDEKVYYSIHLRLEDDWVNHMTKIYKLSKHFGKEKETFSKEIFNEIIGYINMLDNNKIFVATGLGKDEHMNNYMLTELDKLFPNRICVSHHKACDWDWIFPGITNAREIEGYIDFLICLDSKKFISSFYSSFSVSLKYCLKLLGVEYYTYNA